MEKFENVKVGDEVYISSRGLGGIYKVEKVSKTMFTVDGDRFRKSGSRIGAGAWDTTSASIPTDEIRYNIKRRKLISAIENSNLSDKTTKTLEAIVRLLK